MPGIFSKNAFMNEVLYGHTFAHAFCSCVPLRMRSAVLLVTERLLPERISDLILAGAPAVHRLNVNCGCAGTNTVGAPIYICTAAARN